VQWIGNCIILSIESKCNNWMFVPSLFDIYGLFLTNSEILNKQLDTVVWVGKQNYVSLSFKTGYKKIKVSNWNSNF